MDDLMKQLAMFQAQVAETKKKIAQKKAATQVKTPQPKIELMTVEDSDDQTTRGQIELPSDKIKQPNQQQVQARVDQLVKDHVSTARGMKQQ